LSTENPPRDPENAEPPIHFLEICEGWVKKGGTADLRGGMAKSAAADAAMSSMYEFSSSPDSWRRFNPFG